MRHRRHGRQHGPCDCPCVRSRGRVGRRLRRDGRARTRRGCIRTRHDFLLVGLVLLVAAARLSTPTLPPLLVGSALIGAGACAFFTVTTGPVLESNRGRKRARDDLGSAHRPVHRALDSRHWSRGGARPRLKRTQHGAGLRRPCRRVGRCGLRLDAPRTAVREDLSERPSRSRLAPEDLPGCATRSRPQVPRIEPPAAGATIGP